MLRLLIISFLAFSLNAREVIETKGSCQINWTQGIITCQGESAEGQNSFAAKLSAKIIAQRNILEIIKGVRIDSVVTIEEGMFSSEVIRSRVEGVVRGGEIISNKFYKEDGYAVATIKLQMGKDLLSALLSDPNKLSWNEKVQQYWNNLNIVPNLQASTYTQHDKETLEKLLEDLRKNGNQNMSAYISNVLENIEEESYSGVLIDISEISDFKKAMIVKLVDQSGNEIYPHNIVSKKTLLKRNTSVGYMYGIQDARKHKRVLDHPIELKATSIYKKRYSNIILTEDQIQKINALDASVLKNAKIILVLGE